MKKGQVYKRMLMSYVLILFIPIVVSMVLYYNTYRIVREQAGFYNTNLLRTVKDICDREIEYYKEHLIQLKMDDTIRSLVSKRNYSIPVKQLKMYETQKKLVEAYSALVINDTHCHDIFLYISELDKVINQTSVMSLDLYSSFYYKEDEEELRSLLQAGQEQDTLFYQTEHGAQYILILEPLTGINIKKGTAVLGMWLNVEAFESKIRSINWEGGIDWTIIANQEQTYRNTQIFDVNEIDWTQLCSQPEYNIDIDGEEYLTECIKSEVYDWEYALFIPEKNISMSANKIRNLHMISVIAIMIIGGFAARAFMRVNYNPLKNLLDMLTKRDEEKNVENEYRYLETRLSDLITSNYDIKKNMSKSKETVRNYILEELLSSSSVEYKQNEVSAEVYAKFENGKNLVLLCNIRKEFCEEPERKENMIDDKLERYIISNVYAEGIGEVFKLETVEVENKVVIIVNIPWEREDYSEVLQSITEKLCIFIKKHFMFSVCILEGGCYPGIAGIHKSYLEACEAEGVLSCLNEEYIRYEDIQDLSMRKYDYSFEMEELVINAIRNKNAKLAMSFIDNVLENNFHKKSETSSEMLMCLLYDIFGTLIKASEEMGVRNDVMFNLNRINAETSLKDIEAFYKRMVEYICKESEENLGNLQGQELCSEVMRFIEENYTNPELNLAQTALHFHMTPAYLSANFKKYRGESIIEIIRQKRVDYAKKLLEEGVSVSEVARRVGFNESATFIRIFKKYMGVTPGQMQKLTKK